MATAAASHATRFTPATLGMVFSPRPLLRTSRAVDPSGCVNNQAHYMFLAPGGSLNQPERALAFAVGLVISRRTGYAGRRFVRCSDLILVRFSMKPRRRQGGRRAQRLL